MDARRLLSDDADTVVAAACADDRDDLALSEDLRRSYPPDLVGLALTQRALRRRARGKLVDPDSWLLTKDGLEQASATAVAAHRAAKFVGLHTVVDVCCGIGGDSRELARVAGRVVGIDRDPTHLGLAQRNAGVDPVRAEAEALPVALDRVDALVVDPARRAEGRRRRGPEESSPPLSVCFGWATAVDRVTIKAAPGLDLEAVPDGWSVEAVGVGRDLKELALWSPAWGLPRRRATVLRVDSGARTLSTHELDPSAHSGANLPIAGVGRYLYDPNPAVTRTGLVQDLGRTLGASMIDERIAFLTSEVLTTSPFARALEVHESMPWSLKPVKARLRALGIGSVEVRQRGLTAGDVDALRRRLATDEAGTGVLVLTRLGDRPWAVITAEV